MDVYVVVREQGEYSDREVEVVGVRRIIGEALTLAESHRHLEWVEWVTDLRSWGDEDEANELEEWRAGWRSITDNLDNPRMRLLRSYGTGWGWRSGQYWIERHNTEENGS